jgi:DNA-binding CsgD family transcriptional regulator
VSPLPGLRYVLNLEGGAEPFGGAQVETFAVLAPHVSRALATTARLGLTEAYSGDLATALEHTPCGMIFLTPNGQVSFTNDRTERLLGDGLTIEGRTLRSASPDDQAALDALVSSILPGSVRATAEVLVARPSGKGPLLVQGVPIRPRQDRYYERLGIATGGGLLLVQDLAGEGGRSVGADLRRLGLTPAQARVAELVGSGYSPREAASEIGIVESTARAQLKQAYARLGLSKQSELAILVTKLCTIQR